MDSCMYAILLDGKIVGTAGINSFDWENRMFTIGYWLSEDLTGQGIVTKCCSRLIDHCFEDLGHHRACILVAVENFPSRAVPSRLGMSLEGISKDRSGYTTTMWIQLSMPLQNQTGDLFGIERPSPPQNNSLGVDRERTSSCANPVAFEILLAMLSFFSPTWSNFDPSLTNSRDCFGNSRKW